MISHKIKAFQSYRDKEDKLYVIINHEVEFKDGFPTENVRFVWLYNVLNENIKKYTIQEFIDFLTSGRLRRVIKT